MIALKDGIAETNQEIMEQDQNYMMRMSQMKLLIQLYQSTEDPILKEFFAKYIRELDWGTSIPFALSAMNIEMASVLLKNKILLTKEQEEKVEELRKMSNIRYGYPN